MVFSRRGIAMPGDRTYKVTLTEDEREELRKMLTSGKAAARKLNHARMLLYADASAAGLRRTDQEIAEVLGVGLRTVARVRQRFVEEGYAAALQPHPRPRGAYKLDAQTAAQLIELAKSPAPPGHKRWTLRLLAARLVVLGSGAFSHETVRQVLKKTR
jgi:transposase